MLRNVRPRRPADAAHVPRGGPDPWKPKLLDLDLDLDLNLDLDFDLGRLLYSLAQSVYR